MSGTSKKENLQNKYPSRYSNGKQVTAAQYITELICEKKAQKEGKDLPQTFWKIASWSGYFRQQIVVANGLLRLYSEKAIIKALKSQKAYNIFSLRAPHLDDIIKLEEQALKAIPPKKHIKTANTLSKPRKPQHTENLFSKLDE